MLLPLSTFFQPASCVGSEIALNVTCHLAGHTYTLGPGSLLTRDSAPPSSFHPLVSASRVLSKCLGPVGPGSYMEVFLRMLVEWQWVRDYIQRSCLQHAYATWRTRATLLLLLDFLTVPFVIAFSFYVADNRQDTGERMVGLLGWWDGWLKVLNDARMAFICCPPFVLRFFGSVWLFVACHASQPAFWPTEYNSRSCNFSIKSSLPLLAA